MTTNAKLACEGNRGKNASLRAFKFIDQTDRSQESVTAYQAIVRSHVMTEVRRQKRSKAKLEKNPGSRRTVHASERNHGESYKLPEGPRDLYTTISDLASSQDLLNTFDNVVEAGCCFTESLPAQLMNGYECEPATIRSDESRSLQYASESQAAQSAKSCPSNLSSKVLEARTFKLDLTWTQNTCSGTRRRDTDPRKHVPMSESRSDQIDEAAINQVHATAFSPEIIGRSRVDPFRALPIPSNRDVYQLVDHCKFVKAEIFWLLSLKTFKALS